MTALAVSLGAGAALAQSDRQPAEFPPASYNGKQYVDSRGCVFIRAGIDGNVTWVPRVARNRKTVCGFKPTNVGSAQAGPAPKPAQAPVQITLDNAPATAAPAVPAVKTAPVAKPAPRRVAQPRQAPVVVRQTAPVVVRQTAPVRKPMPQIRPAPVIVAAPAPAPVVRAPVGRRVVVATACPGVSEIAQRYMTNRDGLPVRCGPQAAPIVGTRVQQHYAAPSRRQVAAAALAGDAGVSATTRIVPKHVAINRLNTRNVTVPRGYREVWTDDRLNPYRAEQNLQGRNQMALVWTNTVPRRLVNQANGRDVTASVPLVYPYLDIITQNRELGEVTIVQRDGKLVKRIVRNENGRKAARKPVYSSRSAPKPAPQSATAPVRKARAAKTTQTPAYAGKRYLQVGVYRDMPSAQQAAQSIAGLGMPARIGKSRANGKTALTVQAGPFANSDSMQGAVRNLRAAGFSRLIARN